MKILAVLFLHPRIMSGYVVFLAELSKKAKERGDSVLLLFPSQPCPEMKEALAKSGTRYEIMPGWASRKDRLIQNKKKFLFFLLSLFQRENFDIADFHFCEPLTVFLLIVFLKLRRHKTRFVWHVHHTITEPNNFLKAHFSRIKILSLVVDKIIVLSQTTKKNLITRGIKPRKIKIIANGVQDPLLNTNKLPADVKIPPGDVVLISVASLIPRKGHKYLLQAFKIVWAKFPNICLFIAGDGPQKMALLQLSRDLGISEKVFFLGIRSDVPALLKISDIFVHASLAEPFGLAIIEAMACQLPMIISESETTLEVIEAGRNGLITLKQNPETMASAILTLVSDRHLREKMGREGRQIYLAKFTLSKMVREHIAFYQTYV